jgi:hypothetical protein
MQDEVTFEVRDKEVVGSRSLGFASVKVSALTFEGGAREWYTLTHHNEPVGKLLLDTRQDVSAKPKGLVYCLQHRKEMMRSELLPYFTISDAKTLLLLCKATAAAV